MKIKTFLFVSLALLAVSCANNKNKADVLEGTINNRENIACVLKGTIHNNESKTLLLVKSHENERYMGQRISIKEDNTFEYLLNNAANVRYSLIFYDDAFVPIYLFPDNDTIYFDLYPANQYVKNAVSGSEGTEELLKIEKDVRVLFEQELNAINQKLIPLFELNKGESDLAKNLISKSDSISKVHLNWRLNKIETNPSIAKYSMLIDMISAAEYTPQIDKKYLNSIIQSYQKKYPNHFYTELSKNLITASTSITVGGEFVNFKTVDSQGNEIEIANCIKENNITILDLWAPWCAPCRRKSRALIPYYENYKDKKFTIIGVVGGIKDIETYNIAIEQEKFPWKNYIEIKDQNKIWEKYNISNSSGGVFVINNQGTILAIDPNIKDLENILTDNL